MVTAMEECPISELLEQRDKAKRRIAQIDHADHESAPNRQIRLEMAKSEEERAGEGRGDEDV